MTRIPAGVSAPVTATFGDPGLNVGLTLWDDSGTSPVQITDIAGMVAGVLPMLNWSGNRYRAKVPPQTPGKSYLVGIAAYTAPDYLTVDTNEPEGDASLYFEPFQAASGLSGAVIEALVTDEEIIA